MSTFSKEEKVEILSDIVGIKTVNDNEIEVAAVSYTHLTLPTICSV